MQVELEACIYICTSIGKSAICKKAVVCVDSKNLEEVFLKAKSGIGDDRKGFEQVLRVAKSHPNIGIIYVNCRWNQEADYLAKKGKERKHLIEKWF